MEKKFLVLSLLLVCLPVFAEEGWSIVVKPEKTNYFGVTAANGNLGLVSSPEPFKVADVVLANVYDIYGRGDVSNFLKGFNILDLDVCIDGEKVNSGNISGHVQELDMKNAVMKGSFSFKDKAEVEYSFLALRHLPCTGMMNIEITPRKDITVESKANLCKPEAFVDCRSEHVNAGNVELLTLTASSPGRRLDLSATVSFLFGKEDGVRPEHIDAALQNDYGNLSFVKKLRQEETLSYSLVGTTVSDKTAEDQRNESKRLNLYACLEGRDRLMKRHEEAWADLWKGDIIIEGDQESQRDVRSMLYHIYSFVRADSNLSLSPMGLSGLGYNGHVFWDADIWVFPVMLILNQDIARSMIMYRYDRLEAAEKNAALHGYKGAMFPWESADTGMEETPVFALSGPFEHHVTACVAIAAWNYYRATGDRKWLEEYGYEMISKCADFWVSRVELNYDGTYSINNVVAADEFAENVNDNAYTNAAAIVNLRVAAKAARIVGKRPDKRWKQVADRIRILRFEDGVTKEHASYSGETIKQADVNLLAYPLKFIRDKHRIRKDLEYYEGKFASYGPAMTHSILGLLYAELGESDKAYELFKRSYRMNMLPPFGVLAEGAGGDNPYFVTAAGGTLQCVLMGFGGIDITDSGIRTVARKSLPDRWKSLVIKGVGPERQTIEIINKNTHYE